MSARSSETDLIIIANEFGPEELQHLFHTLGIQQRDIKHAEASADTTDTSLKALAVLRWWETKTGEEAPIISLLEAKRKLTELDTDAAAEAVFRDITKGLCFGELQRLFHFLGIEDGDIRRVEAEAEDTRLNAVAVLRWWKQTNKNAATREVLLEAKRKVFDKTATATYADLYDITDEFRGPDELFQRLFHTLGIADNDIRRVEAETEAETSADTQLKRELSKAGAVLRWWKETKGTTATREVPLEAKKEALKTATATEADFRDITNELSPQELQRLFENLGITPPDINHAKAIANTRDYRLKASAVLRDWLKRNGIDALIEALLYMIVDANKKEAEEALGKCCGIMNISC